MREKKFTPGEWKIDARVGCVAVYPAIENRNCLSGSDASAVHFKHGYKDTDDGWCVTDIDVANANLIAAAPELLEALENAISLLKTLCGNTDDIANAIFEISDKAIAKAYGDES